MPLSSANIEALFIRKSPRDSYLQLSLRMLMFFLHQTMVCLKFLFSCCAALFFTLPWPAQSFTPSSFLGPSFPAPLKLSKDANIQTVNEKFLTLINNALNTGTSICGDFGANTTAFSFGNVLERRRRSFCTNITTLPPHSQTPQLVLGLPMAILYIESVALQN